jgi:hypothetical protein
MNCKEKRFPKEILRIIKEYEYSLYWWSKKRKYEIIEKIKVEVAQPYYLRGTTYHKSDQGQISNFMDQMKPIDFQYINVEELTELIKIENRRAQEESW